MFFFIERLEKMIEYKLIEKKVWKKIYIEWNSNVGKNEVAKNSHFDAFHGDPHKMMEIVE